MADIDVIFISDAEMRDEIIEALHYHNASAKRCPRHWVDRLAGIHARMNDLLDELEEIGF